MASLNISINGPSIKSSYQGVVNGPALSSSSSTYAQWALFSVQAPLMNAFQDSAAKESILKVESTGEGELEELIEDFNEGRIQFAFLKVKDPNTGLPKNVLIAWCGGGVPERTKGYFTSHTAAVAKVLHGYHVQITARSDADLEPSSIMKKVSDASGSKYTAGGSAPMSAAPPPVAKKPVFTPTALSAASNPLVAARNRKQDNVDEDGWGADAPPVTRTQLEKVESAYKPTKVNMAELTKQKPEPPRLGGGSAQAEAPGDLVRGGYQPVGKVDIAAIRAAAKKPQDDRPTIVKGAYEPVGKVDIAAIRARAQKPAEEEAAAPEPSRSLADRSAAFSQPQSERLTTLPKPKVANKFGGAASFTGTKAPTPGGLGFSSPAVPSAAPVGAASRTFADQGGKTPAQIWAEKKARQGGSSGSAITPPLTSPIAQQRSGSEWKSGYSGKSWATVQTPKFGRGGVASQNTGDTANSEPEQPASPASGGGVSGLRDRFKETQPMGQAAPAVPRFHTGEQDEPAPPLPVGSRPPGAFQLPGLPSRPPPAQDDEEEDEAPEREESPPRVAIPVSRERAPEMHAPEEREPPRPLPVRQPEPEPSHVEEPQYEDETHHEAGGAGKTAVAQYDYEKAEDNEIDLQDGEHITNIDMVDEDWWMGTNSKGETGLFPSSYVEIVEGGAGGGGGHAVPPPPPPAAAAEPEPAHHEEAAAGGGGGATATALFDYEAAEDNELSFPEGATITDMEFPDEDWWFGHYHGSSGLFPANYVQLDS